MDTDDETYILLLLSDSNLPTGSFVASSGLESFVTHGFSTNVTDFIHDSLATYARTAIPFVSDAHRILQTYTNESGEDEDTEQVLNKLLGLDDLYEAMTLNHVARRASKAQGIALLALHSKGFSRPPSLAQNIDAKIRAQELRISKLLDKYKLLIRREEAPGHLAICWGILTGALGLSLERTQYLHLFLHARSLLSAAVRLNSIGPYGAQQILLHAVRPLVAAEAHKVRDLRTGELPSEDPAISFEQTLHGPANTWPLGEILAARHDLQHSRIFNS